MSILQRNFTGQDKCPMSSKYYEMVLIKQGTFVMKTVRTGILVIGNSSDSGPFGPLVDNVLHLKLYL